MSNLGPRWQDDENYSPARMDAKTIFRDTGTNIVATATTRQLGLVCPTDTSGGLIKNVLYYVDYDSSFNRLGFEPVFRKHLHNATTAEAGGRLLDIEFANLSNVGRIEMVSLRDLDGWDIETGSGGTAVYDDTIPAHKFETGVTTGAYAGGCIKSGLDFAFDDNLAFQFGLDTNANSNLVIRVGLNVDNTNQTPNTAIRKIGIEGCDGHGVNWVLINGNGNSGSQIVTATTMPLSTTFINAYALFHIPATENRVYKNGISNAVSTTNIASDGDTDKTRVMRASIKLAVGTTTKKLWISYYQIVGNIAGNLINIV
ncbi:hypothetical protein [Serratia sp. (in: enterobacteria)]|uniref:hypothetical protein n=1 Tax=Serratia sp. (in: enterobacteria) TaxID=616 RepID=UPI0039891DE2